MWLVAFVSVMVAVPTVMLFADEESSPFGWQMFAKVDRLVTYEVERGGLRSDLDWTEWVVTQRTVFGARAHLAPHVCTRDRSIDAVWTTVQRIPSLDTSTERYACRP